MRYMHRALFACALFACALFVAGACAQLPNWMRPRAEPRPNEALYWNAVSQLDAANRQGSLDSALALLESYLGSGQTQDHRAEAVVLRQLARDAQQLAKVQAAPHSASTGPEARPSTDARPQTETKVVVRDEESVKEIQRLKEELAKANEELERIRKRLAPHKPPGASPP